FVPPVSQEKTTVSPAKVVYIGDNNSSGQNITFTLKDADGNVLKNRKVKFVIAGADDWTITPPIQTSDANGICTFNLKWNNTAILEPDSAHEFNFALNTPADKIPTAWKVVLWPDTPGKPSKMSLADPNQSLMLRQRDGKLAIKLKLDLQTKGGNGHAIRDDITKDLVLLDNGNPAADAKITQNCVGDAEDRYCNQGTASLTVNSFGVHKLGLRYTKAAQGADNLEKMYSTGVVEKFPIGTLVIKDHPVDVSGSILLTMGETVDAILTVPNITTDISSKLKLIENSINGPQISVRKFVMKDGDPTTYIAKYSPSIYYAVHLLVDCEGSYGYVAGPTGEMISLTVWGKSK
ncbi:hypothetical protein, partial [Bartonella sp. TP]|uniref:hypothetical protein n=1 Tax=Bartonella sp. TP TaxID=3057550 RepID=UPI0025B25F2B